MPVFLVAPPAQASPTASTHRSTLQAPVITERFTRLRCNQSTTLGLEGCSEAQTLSLDKQIDGVAKSIFTRLFDRSSKLRFIQAEAAWLTYRRAMCESRSDAFEGGSQARVVYAACLVDLDQLQLQNLQQFLSTFRS
jgi:uncharacterized protein YecT (DUF1311 family)